MRAFDDGDRVGGARAPAQRIGLPFALACDEPLNVRIAIGDVEAVGDGVFDDLGGVAPADVNDDVVVAPALGSERHRRGDLMVLGADEFEVGGCRCRTALHKCRSRRPEQSRHGRPDPVGV